MVWFVSFEWCFFGFFPPKAIGTDGAGTAVDVPGVSAQARVVVVFHMCDLLSNLTQTTTERASGERRKKGGDPSVAMNRWQARWQL